MKGKELDIAHFLAVNGHQIALGNASMNARGDIVGRGGKVIRKREEVVQEYYERNPKAAKPMPHAISADVFQTPAEAVESARQQKALVEKAVPAVQAVPPDHQHKKRTIADSSE
jgi:hypothetical protein